MEFDQSEFFTKIWQFNSQNPLGLSVLSLYFYLLKVAYEKKSLNFTLSESRISRELKMTRKTVKIGKEKLRKYGIISFKSRSGLPCDFQLISEYPLIFKDLFEQTEEIYKIPEIKKIQNKFELQKVNSEIKDTQQILSIVETNKNIPTIEEFLEYAQSLEMYDPQLHSEIQLKYDNWKSNNWKNSANRPITDWKSSLKSVLPYLKNSTQNNSLSVKTIPAITPPKLSNF